MMTTVSLNAQTKPENNLTWNKFPVRFIILLRLNPVNLGLIYWDPLVKTLIYLADRFPKCNLQVLIMSQQTTQTRICVCNTSRLGHCSRLDIKVISVTLRMLSQTNRITVIFLPPFKYDYK